MKRKESKSKQSNNIRKKTDWSSVTDITEIVRIEESLRESEQRDERRAAELEAIFAAQNYDTLVFDTEMNVRMVTPSFATTFGFDPVGQNLKEIVRRISGRWLDGRPFIWEEMPTPRALKGERVTGALFVIKRTDGTEAIIETSSGPVRVGGRIIGSVTVWNDITERTRVEQALRNSEERFRQLADATFEGILIHDKGVILDVNQALTRLTGYDYEEAIGKDVFAFIAPESKELVLHRMQYPDTTPFEISLIKKDRTTCLVEGVARDITYGGKMVRVVAMRDITERKKKEEELKERTAQLEAANKELESFSYSVSHDLRAPLRAIDGYARMILKKHGDKFDEDALNKFNTIRSSAHIMGQLIDDLLTFSRLGRKQISISKIDMDQVVRDVWKELRIIDPDRNINLTLKVITPGYGDRALIKQVYLNLLSNAFKFTKHRDEARIEVGGEIDENESVYYVKDNGVGFDMVYYDKLFGVFQRLHSSDDFEGTGVGLATVQRIIHRHGGRVWAEGKVNEGATFYFTLPHS